MTNRQPELNGTFASTKQVQERIRALHDGLGISFPEIASRGVLKAIPVGTIYDIYSTGKVPRKWRKALGIKGRQRISINKLDMRSACDTITMNLRYSDVKELHKLLGYFISQREEY